MQNNIYPKNMLWLFNLPGQFLIRSSTKTIAPQIYKSYFHTRGWRETDLICLIWSLNLQNVYRIEAREIYGPNKMLVYDYEAILFDKHHIVINYFYETKFTNVIDKCVSYYSTGVINTGAK